MNAENPKDSLTILKDNLAREFRALRQDLQDLKRCQLQYFTMAVASTGAILGFAALIARDTTMNSMLGLALLSPLAVIFPCWLIFFDKATTITRITGYQCLVEEQLASDEQKYRFPGYENSLALFRLGETEAWKSIRANSDTRLQRPARTALFLLLATRHRYWTLNWYTFLGLSLFAWFRAAAFLMETHPTALAVSIVFSAACAVYTARQIWLLIFGRRSYDASTKIWKKILAK